MPIYECRHMRANGFKCQALALKGSNFCYFHTRTRQLSSHLLDLPLLEDHESIQLAIHRTLNSLSTGFTDAKTASTILYGLQLAQTNIAKSNFHKSSHDAEVDVIWDDPETREELGPLLLASRDYQPENSAEEKQDDDRDHEDDDNPDDEDDDDDDAEDEDDEDQDGD